MEKNIFLSNLELVKIAGALSADIEASKRVIEETKKKKMPYEYLVDSVNNTEKLLKKIESLLW